MKKLLKILGSLLYGAVMYYLLWLLIYWITPYIMAMNWGWFIAYTLIAGGAITVFVGAVASLQGTPLMLMSNNCKLAKFLPIPFGLLFGYSAVKLPWIIEMDYGFLQWILAIMTTIIVLISFVSLLIAPFNMNEED